VIIVILFLILKDRKVGVFLPFPSEWPNEGLWFPKWSYLALFVVNVEYVLSMNSPITPLLKWPSQWQKRRYILDWRPGVGFCCFPRLTSTSPILLSACPWTCLSVLLRMDFGCCPGYLYPVKKEDGCLRFMLGEPYNSSSCPTDLTTSNSTLRSSIPSKIGVDFTRCTWGGKAGIRLSVLGIMTTEVLLSSRTD